MLICRFKQWPSRDQQNAFLEQMLNLGLRRPITSAVIDLTAIDQLPDPAALADAIARAVGKNAVLNRVACLACTPEQEQFCATLQRMVNRPDNVATFLNEDAALKWLGVEQKRR